MEGADFQCASNLKDKISSYTVLDSCTNYFTVPMILLFGGSYLCQNVLSALRSLLRLATTSVLQGNGRVASDDCQVSH